MQELALFLLIFVLPWWAYEHRDLFAKPNVAAPRDDGDWIRSTTKMRWLDPLELFSAGLIDKYTCVELMTAQKRYISSEALLGIEYARGVDALISGGMNG